MEKGQTVFKTSIPGVLRIERPTIPDDRGFFREWIRVGDLEVPFEIKQANHARSSKSTLRGIHVAPWNKLVYITRGKVQEIVVDLRKDSETYGKYESFILGEEQRSSIFIPKGCGNSYLVLSDESDYVYLTDEEWSPGKEFEVAWDDPDIAIDWALEGDPVISDRDLNSPKLKDLP